EPRCFVAARRLRRVGRGPLVSAPCRVDGEHVLIDLANSLPTTAAGGPLADLGPLHLALLPEGQDPQLIGQIDYLSSGWYEQRGGISRLELSPTDREQAAGTPLGVVRVRDGEIEVLLRENAAGAYVQGDRLVFRLEPDRDDPPESTTFFATTFGSLARGP